MRMNLIHPWIILHIQGHLQLQVLNDFEESIAHMQCTLASSINLCIVVPILCGMRKLELTHESKTIL